MAVFAFPSHLILPFALQNTHAESELVEQTLNRLMERYYEAHHFAQSP